VLTIAAQARIVPRLVLLPFGVTGRIVGGRDGAGQVRATDVLPLAQCPAVSVDFEHP